MVPSRQVNQAVEEFVASSRYRPPPLPILFTSKGDWHPSILPENTPAKLQILARSAKKGKEVFDFVIFMLLESETDDLPSGLVSTMRSALQQDNVLNAIMAKIHPTLVVGVSNVKTGFFSFVNYVWEGLKKDSFKTAEHLRRIFSPILEAASSVYLSEIPKPKTTKRAREAARSSTVPANIVFLHNLRNRQRTEIPNGSFDADSEASYQEESSSEQSIPRPIHYSSPPAIPRFEDQELSPLDPAVLLRGNIRLPETRPLPDYQTHSIGFPSPSPMFYYSPPTLPGSAENLSPRPFDSAPGPSLGRGENNPASTRFAYAGFNLSQRINAETRSPLLLPAATIFSTPAASRTSYTAAAAADEEFAALLANGPTSPEVLAAGASQFSLHNVGGESGTPVHEQQTQVESLVSSYYISLTVQELTAAELEYFIYEKESPIIPNPRAELVLALSSESTQTAAFEGEGLPHKAKKNMSALVPKTPERREARRPLTPINSLPKDDFP